MRRLLSVCILAAAGVAGFSAQQLSAQQPTFKTGIDLVTFGVTVVDRRGNLVTDLSRDDFDVIEDGNRQVVEYFLRGDEGGEADDRGRLHLGLMLDTSGSMLEDLKLARGAAIKFLNLLPEAEDITLVDFDTEVRVTRYPQRDFARLVERIRMRKADGWTALYDALGVYLDGADHQEGRKILVVYTDGGDTRSTISFGDVLTLLKASQATVYAVGLLDRMGSHRQDARMKLQQIVETTGGQAFFPSRLEDLDESYEKVLAEIKAQYHLGYASANLARDGAWRKVEIKVKRSDVKVRTRKGYFAPYQSEK